jgi:hypothetical protein
MHNKVESSILFVSAKFRKIHNKWVFLNIFVRYGIIVKWYILTKRSAAVTKRDYCSDI